MAIQNSVAGIAFSMAWFLFTDESGCDHKEAPYEVLAGVAIQDNVVWKVIQELHSAEIKNFGRRYSAGTAELKGRKLLKKKVFQHAGLSGSISDADIPILAKEAIDNGSAANVRHLKALAIAKQRYVSDVFSICGKYGCKIFASVVDNDAPQTASGGLRKDYAYLFERFYYFLEDSEKSLEHGIIVFDELDKSRSHILVDQAHRYFKDTATGRLRASLILPEPFFVHSDLTTGIQIADLAAYCISWGFKINSMKEPRREELTSYASQISGLRFKCQRKGYDVWSITHIHDLRTALERNEGESEDVIGTKKGNAA